METDTGKLEILERLQTIDHIREHYDSLSPLYRTFWGEHIHHGFWRGEEPAADAQENLVRELAGKAGLIQGERVLDIGCGLGGSSLYLARTYGAKVKGISISSKQIDAARREAARLGLESQVSFSVQDAHRIRSEETAVYDVIWIIECSEHLFDKPKFMADCAHLLAPGGRLAVCAWLMGEHLDAQQDQLVNAVRHGMLCPSFGTLDDYASWMTAAGLQVTYSDDITAQVQRTWALCKPVLKFPLVKTMLSVGGEKLRAFADSFESIDEAYRTGAMRYGMFVARKA